MLYEVITLERVAQQVHEHPAKQGLVRPHHHGIVGDGELEGDLPPFREGGELRGHRAQGAGEIDLRRLQPSYNFV